MSRLGLKQEVNVMSAVIRLGDLEEGALIASASKGDLQAFNQLVLSYQDMAYHHACGMLGDPDLAEDVTQESFLKVFQRLNGFRGGSFRAWLLRIVTNTAYDTLRVSRPHLSQPLFPEEDGEQVESPAWMMDPDASVQAAVEQREFSQAIHQVLAELPDVHRHVLTLIDLYEFDYAEAAQALGIPLGTVKSRLARARLQVQEKLRDIPDVADHLPGIQTDLAA